MMGFRVDVGGLIQRDKPLPFTFDGKPMTGLEGDTVASALLSNGVKIIGRSFKYHRPRGFFGSWVDDPNGFFDIELNGFSRPNCQGTTTMLEAGMNVRSVNAWPSAKYDLKGGLDLFHRWLPAGFYYKMFMWPNWHLFEPAIRRMAGLGAAAGDVPEDFVSDQLDDNCDLLVVGGGAAGLASARAAAEAGQDVVLVDDHRDVGGGLYRRAAMIEGAAPSEWIAAQVNAIKDAGARILTKTTAFGAYDHGLFALSQDLGFSNAPRFYRMRTKRVILASGALDRPLTFERNDLPGIMSIEAASEFLGRYGVGVGSNVAIAASSNLSDHSAAALNANVRSISLADGPLQAIGRKALRGVAQGSQQVAADTLLVSAGWTPLVHLWCHAGGKLDWSEDHAAFLPGHAPDGMQAIGAANGTYDLDQALAEARAVALGTPVPKAKLSFSIEPQWPDIEGVGRQWIDFQHDVTVKDIALAARENYVSVEHLKRYTTLGMAEDQGKTSNMAGMAAMAALQGKSIPEIGTTTFRPPFVPVPLEGYHGTRRGAAFNPLKRLALEHAHRAAGAALGEYGGWLRPGWYGSGAPEDEAEREALMARETVGVFDASPLGKIEVMGPDAAAFVNFIYYNTVKTLKAGHIRYGFMLTEKGVVYDDGVVTRLDDNRFLISCSSSHVDGVCTMLEAWRQDGHDPDRIFVHDTTSGWATVTVTGPKARDVVAVLGLPLDLSANAFGHMTMRETEWQGHQMRVSRVSFTGDLSFELSVRASHAGALWDSMLQAADNAGGGAIGLEALSILRAEKGYLIIGKDTDGETMPHDLGVTAPRDRKTAAYVGDRGLQTPVAKQAGRRALVGLASDRVLETGAHLVTGKDAPKSIGVVTSSYFSPILGTPIALALLDDGTQKTGDVVEVWHLGSTTKATVTQPCFFDPEGDRLHA